MKIIILSFLLGLGFSMTADYYGVYNLYVHTMIAAIASVPCAFVIFSKIEDKFNE